METKLYKSKRHAENFQWRVVSKMRKYRKFCKLLVPCPFSFQNSFLKIGLTMKYLTWLDEYIVNYPINHGVAGGFVRQGNVGLDFQFPQKFILVCYWGDVNIQKNEYHVKIVGFSVTGHSIVLTQ